MREKHCFTFSAAQISGAAANQRDYHKTRYDYWDKEYTEGVAAMKAAGFEVREYDVTGGKRAQVVIDNSLQSKVDLAISKREQHFRAIEVFKVEAAVYASQPPFREYDLDAADVMHWRLAGGPMED